MAAPERAERPTTPARTEEGVTVAGPPEIETGGVLTIDLTAIEINWKSLASRVSPSECAAVVKADAYGCGLEPVVAMLARSRCETFFVAHLAEARRVHAVAPSTVVYVLNGIVPGSASAFAEANARPVIGDLAELAEWEAFCAASGWNGGAALHFDTGMNRLGFSMDEAAALAPRASKPNHGITLVMSHLACAETPKHPMNERQIQQFREIRTMFRGIPSSLANSTGIFLGGATHCDMVRPGLGLYGGNPTPEHDNPMRPVVELKGRILQVKKVASGSSVGYEAAWTARHPSHIATVAVGYADGYLRAAGATGRQAHAEVVIAGKRCPVIGRVSMDLLAVDVTNIPEKDVHRGDFAILIGAKIGIDDLAAWSGTIGYEVLTSLGRRYTRKYRIG